MLFRVVKFSKPPGKSETMPLCVFSMLPSEISVYLVVAVLLLAFYFSMQKNLDHFCYCCKFHNPHQIHEIINGHIFTIGCPKIYIREVSNKKIASNLGPFISQVCMHYLCEKFTLDSTLNDTRHLSSVL